MEPTITSQQPARTVGDELDRLEVRAGKIGLITSAQAFELLSRLDTVYHAIQQLDLDGQSRKIAEAQFDGIVSRLHTEAGQFVRDLGGVQELQKAREKINPPPEYVWWYLDQHLNEKRRTSLRKILIVGGIILTLVIALVVVYNAFLAPDPQVVAVYTHQQTAQDFLMKGELVQALEEVDKGLEIKTDDPDLLVVKGIILEKMGRFDEAAEIFTTAEMITAAREVFLVARGQAYLMSGQPEKGLADAQEAIQLNPSYTQAYMISGQAHELLLENNAAMDDYEKAFEAAEKAEQVELQAIIRTRMAMLLQMMNVQAPYPGMDITPTVQP